MGVGSSLGIIEVAEAVKGLLILFITRSFLGSNITRSVSEGQGIGKESLANAF